MPRMWRMRRISHEGIHEWGQNRTGAEKDQPREHQQDDDQGNQPPLFFLFQKRQEFFAKQPHTLLELNARFSQWQRQRRHVSLAACANRESRPSTATLSRIGGHTTPRQAW